MDHNILSNRILSLSESATLAMTNKSRELKSKGFDVITLSIGEPDFNTPDHVKKAGIDAINNNNTHYSPVPGFPELKQAIAEKLKRDNGLEYNPTQIVVSNGAKQSIANIFMCILNAGDEVVIPAPYWVSYPDMVKMADGTPVIVQTNIENDFKIKPEELEQSIGPKTKAVLINSPSNPTGAVYSYDELAALAEVFARHPDVVVISDEIYEYIIFSGNHISLASFENIKDQVVIVNGVSKGFAMTGWRIGYMAAPQFIAKACNTFQGQYTSGASSISQAAAMEAIRTEPEASEEIKQMVDAFQKRRDLLIRLMDDIPGVKTYVPEGAFYLFPDISHYLNKHNGDHLIKDSTDLCLYLLEKAFVACVPGDAFGNEHCIRLSYATSQDKIEEAIKRIKAALANLN